MRQWGSQINRLIKELARKRGSERLASGMSRIHSARTSSHPTMGSPKIPNALSIPLERESVTGYERTRVQMEGTDRAVFSPEGSVRSITPRMNSNMSMSSAISYTSDATSVNGSYPATRPPLRSQFSSNLLGNGYESPNGFGFAPPSNPTYRHTHSLAPSISNPSVNGFVAPSMNRSRSFSQPGVYSPPSRAIPPVPNGSLNWSQGASSSSGVRGNKRGSGSSQSTAESSDNSLSPLTPYGSSESSLGGGAIQPDFDGGFSPVKVKVHFHEDIFVIQVPRTMGYGDLVEKVGRKIRLCGPRRDDGPLRVKYRDEDGDMISLGSTEDVQMAFEGYRPGLPVTLFVT